MAPTEQSEAWAALLREVAAIRSGAGNAGIGELAFGLSTHALRIPQATSAGNEGDAGGSSGVLEGLPRAVSGLLAQALAPTSGIAGISNRPGGAWGLLRWLNPIAGLFGLFRREDEPAVTSPAELRYFPQRGGRHNWGVSAQDGWQVRESDWDAWGRGRLNERSAPVPQVIVQVQTMDSQSFMDHSDRIAEAVKRSLLESHGLADTLREL
jgi:hypothetical protein